jgi:hypothetical protein
MSEQAPKHSAHDRHIEGTSDSDGKNNVWSTVAAQVWSEKHGDKPEPRDFKSDFRLKPQADSAEQDISKIAAELPDLAKRMRVIAGEAHTQSQQVESDYRLKALGQMVAKYVTERVDNTLRALAELQPDHQLNQYILNTGNSRERTNKSLYNLNDLVAADKADELRTLSQQIRSEGYTKTLPLSDLSPSYVNLLLSKPEERRALKEFEMNPDWASVERFQQQHPQHYYHDRFKPTETMTAFNAFKAKGAKHQ